MREEGGGGGGAKLHCRFFIFYFLLLLPFNQVSFSVSLPVSAPVEVNSEGTSETPDCQEGGRRGGMSRHMSTGDKEEVRRPLLTGDPLDSSGLDSEGLSPSTEHILLP